MPIDTKKAVLGLYDIDEAYHHWVREELEEWIENYIDVGIDPNRPSTFDQEHVDAIRKVVEELGDTSLSVLRDEIDNMLGEMELSMELAEGQEVVEEEPDNQNSFDPDYENMALEDFEPMVRNVFSAPKNSIYKKRDYA